MATVVLCMIVLLFTGQGLGVAANARGLPPVSRMALPHCRLIMADQRVDSTSWRRANISMSHITMQALGRVDARSLHLPGLK